MGACQAHARSGAFLGPQAGRSPPDKGRCSREGSKCLFAGFPKEAAPPSPDPEEVRWLFLWLSPHLTCVSVCLSLGLLQSLSPTRRQRAGRHPWPLHRPTLAPTRPPWSTAGAEAAGQLVQLLDSRAVVSSSVSRSTSTRGRREKGCGHRSPGEAEYRPAARKMSPNMHRQGQGGRVRGEGSSQQLLSELVKDHGGLEVGGLHALAEGDEEVHDLADFGQLRQALPELEGVGLVPIHGV